MIRGPATRGEGGFVLALVVLMLFAISVAGAAGYLVVNTEFSMARYSEQGAEAETVARGGLHRFVAEQLGVVGDSVSYAIGNGVALITTRKVAELDSLNHLYYVRSEGTVVDVLHPGTPARRVVGAYAYYHRRPLRHWGTLVTPASAGWSDNVNANGATVNGNDQNTSSDCVGGGAAAIPGIIARVSTGTVNGGQLQGNPPGRIWSGGAAAIYDSVGLRWDILTNPSFPVDFDTTPGSPPNFAALPPDSFPVVRVNGPYFNPGSTWSGRGVLIVTGELDGAPGFDWSGIILAGELDDIHESTVRGMVISGFNGSGTYSNVYWRGTLRYYSCYVYAANESLSYLELIDNTEFESF